MVQIGSVLFFLHKEEQKFGHSSNLVTAVTGAMTIRKLFQYARKEKDCLLTNYWQKQGTKFAENGFYDQLRN